MPDRRSQLHQHVYNLLMDLFPLAKIHEEYPIKARGKTLYIDILVNSPVVVAFEVQGVQHRQFTPMFHESADDLNKQRLNDHLKAVWCAENNIPLVYISEQDVNITRDELLQKINNAVGDSGQ